MRETHNIDKCDNDQCGKVILDERKDFRSQYYSIFIRGNYWTYTPEKGKAMSLSSEDKNLIFCSEECMTDYVKKYFAKIKMATLKQ